MVSLTPAAGWPGGHRSGSEAAGASSLLQESILALRHGDDHHALLVLHGGLGPLCPLLVVDEIPELVGQHSGGVPGSRWLGAQMEGDQQAEHQKKES